MLKINNDFECERDTYGWKLHHWRDGTSKDGEATRSCRTTYHGKLEHICDHIIDVTAGQAETAEELRQLIAQAKSELREALADGGKA